MLDELERELERRRQERIDRGEVYRVTEWIVAGHEISLARMRAEITASLRSNGEKREIEFPHCIVTGVPREARGEADIDWPAAEITWDDRYPISGTRH
jgi:hypothetical protein